MRTSPPPLPRKTISSATARNAAIVNQLATPGLGSLVARRWVAGAGQLLLALTGFCFVIAWFVAVLIQFYGQIEGNVKPHPVGWIGETGAVIFFAAWLWAWVTSISLLREARRNAIAELQRPFDGPSTPAK